MPFATNESQLGCQTEALWGSLTHLLRCQVCPHVLHAGARQRGRCHPQVGLDFTIIYHLFLEAFKSFWIVLIEKFNIDYIDLTLQESILLCLRDCLSLLCQVRITRTAPLARRLPRTMRWSLCILDKPLRAGAKDSWETFKILWKTWNAVKWIEISCSQSLRRFWMGLLQKGWDKLLWEYH